MLALNMYVIFSVETQIASSAVASPLYIKPLTYFQCLQLDALHLQVFPQSHLIDPSHCNYKIFVSECILGTL